MQGIKFSIVIPTLNRVTEVDAVLGSIAHQAYQDLEVIIVDQNGDDRLAAVIAKHSNKLRIQHFRVAFRGASKARNYGARYASGEILFFPDDDAELLPDFLRKAEASFSENPNCDVIFGKCVDRLGHDSVARFSEKSGYLTRKMHVGMFIEATMLIKRDVFLEHLFDESLGVGTFHGAEEAYDLVLRLLANNRTLYYTPHLQVYHPNKVKNYQDPDEIRRVFTYRCGFSKLCLKHKMYGKLISRVGAICLYVPFLILKDRSRCRYYISELLGLLSGITVK